MLLVVVCPDISVPGKRIQGSMFYLLMCARTKNTRVNVLLVAVYPDLCVREENTRVTVLPVAVCPDREDKC